MMAVALPCRLLSQVWAHPENRCVSSMLMFPKTTQALEDAAWAGAQGTTFESNFTF